MNITFCITCKNRLHQIKKTLQKNLLDNFQEKNRIDFLLVDFGTKGLKEWVLDNFQADLNSGYLKYYYTEELTYWHACVGKNTSHFLADNDFLINLDCDNYTGVKGGKFILDKINKPGGHKIIIHQFSGEYKDGSFGRIGMAKRYFEYIGGYDESFLPMSVQDTDLMKRAESLGLILDHCPNPLYSSAEINTKEESTKYCDTDLQWDEMLSQNQQKLEHNMVNQIIRVNNGIYGIRKNIFNHKNERVY